MFILDGGFKVVNKIGGQRRHKIEKEVGTLQKETAVGGVVAPLCSTDSTPVPKPPGSDERSPR